jgi:hypothetical protein
LLFLERSAVGQAAFHGGDGALGYRVEAATD